MNKKTEKAVVQIAGSTVGIVGQKLVEKGIDVIAVKAMPSITLKSWYGSAKGGSSVAVGVVTYLKADKLKLGAKATEWVKNIGAGIAAGGVSTLVRSAMGNTLNGIKRGSVLPSSWRLSLPVDGNSVVADNDYSFSKAEVGGYGEYV